MTYKNLKICRRPKTKLRKIVKDKQQNGVNDQQSLDAIGVSLVCPLYSISPLFTLSGLSESSGLCCSVYGTPCSPPGYADEVGQHSKWRFDFNAKKSAIVV